jgi:two-component system, sensor histidine kinase
VAEPVALSAAAPAGPLVHDAASARLAETVRFTYGYMPAALAGYVAGVGVVAMLFWGAAPMSLLAPWMAVFALMLAVRIVVIRNFRRAEATESAGWHLADWRRWIWRANIGAMVAAAFWGTAAWLFYDQGTALEQTGLIIIVYTFCAVGIPVLSIQRRLYLVFAALIFLPLLARVVMVGDRFHYLLAGELVLIISFTFVLANSYRQALQRAIDLKVQADELAIKLRVETLAADAARREAEIANRAKTQFFTAASHDLRQPLHAMGLFAEALRQRVHEPEVAQLVNSINESVDALEGLFSELLDITRIDSGGIDVHDQHFEVGDILRKLRLNFEPAAFEKGLALRLRGGHRVVFGDPLLVERILRNLVSNAIRYTNDGSVLVSCRQRGKRVLLQVWDSGPGIREAEQKKIFDEFYQVPHTGAVSPEQRKGLGLGLAIVKRLATLMKAPLAMRSEVGHGTVFTLELPVGKAPRASAQVLPGKGPVGITLAGRLIVVVEDEPAVRAGLEVLLKGWGAEIASFENVAESARWAQASDPGLVKPDLLIVDYRLEEGRTGVDAIHALRDRFGAHVPAILITGSTMTGHDKEAQAHDFHLLIKPVVPNRLRAMIAFKLGVKALG